jgi:hypothetical protein
LKRYLAVVLSFCLLFPGISFLVILNIEGSGPDPHWGPIDINTKVCDARGNQEDAIVVPSDDGGVFISWLDRRNSVDYDVYIQKMDRFGNSVFQQNGMPVCTAPGNQTGLQMITDDIGGVFLVWEDKRDMPPNQSIYGQRIEWDGTVSWAENGTALTDAPYPSIQTGPRIVMDGTGGFILSWLNDTFVDDIFPYNIQEIYVQRFLQSGDRYWPDDVKIVEEQDHLIKSDMVDDGDGGAIILWEDSYGPLSTDIFAQKVNGNGIIEWVSPVTICAEVRDQYSLHSIPDGKGGVISAWGDERAGAERDIYATRLNSTGEEQWGFGGIPICTENADQQSPEVFMNEDNEIFVIWTDFRMGGSSIFMQKVDMNGSIHFKENGTEVGDPYVDKWVPKPVLGNDGFFYLFWFQGTVGSFNVHGQLFRSNGSMVWDDHSKVISNAPRNQMVTDACRGALGSAFIVWYDDRYYDFEIDLYMTRVGSSITTRSPETEVWEDDAYYFNLDSSMEDVAWSLPIGPDWLSIDPVTGELSGTPLNGDVGTSNVWAKIKDGTGNSDILSFQITVKNHAPIIVSDDPTPNAQEESEYQFNYQSSDDGQGTITWALLEGPEWLSMNSTTGQLSGTPQNDDVGKYFIRISVDDGNDGVAEFSYMLTVEDDNDPPSLFTDWLPNGATQMMYYSLLTAGDPDLKEEILVFSMETNADWLNLNVTNGLLFGKPYEQRNYWINISVTDIEGANDWKNFTIEVLRTGAPPPGFDELTDTDEDGMPDAWEIYYGLDKDNASDAFLDPDDDGILNIDEFKNGSSPIRFDPKPLFDSDADGMLDIWEDQYYLNKWDSGDAMVDTDGDGFLNLWEYQNLTNPLDPLSHPPYPPADDDDDDDIEVQKEKDLELTYIIVACVIFLGLVIFGIFYLAGSSRKKRTDDYGWEE